jgi:hypothetical protein
MDMLYDSVPFVAAIVALIMLIAGALRLRAVLFVASFPVIFLACGLALAGGYPAGIAPAFLVVFGFASIALSVRVRPGVFVSRGGLCAIGAFLGSSGMFR